MFKYKKDNILLDTFNNISEFYKYISSTEPRKTAGNSSESGSKDFTDTYNLEDAYKLLLGGDEKLYSDYRRLEKISVSKLLGNVINRPKEKNDVVGFQANVPQYLLGLPTNMINQEPKKTSQKILNIALSFCVSCWVDTEDIKKVGNLYIQVIELLEKAGYRVNLYLVCATKTYKNGNLYDLIRIKTDREPFNIKKCIFPLMHPSMLRRLNFKYWEVCDCYTDGERDFTKDGYGTVNDNKKEIKQILEKVLKTNFIVWRFQELSGNLEQNVKRVLDELKKDYGIEII